MHFEDSSKPETVSNQGASGWRFAVSAGILGWILDAFDFFVVVFLITELMGKFHVSKAAIVWTMTLTLAMRPVGALFFGALADRFGRKRPLIARVLYFSVVTMLRGLAPTYGAFLVTRLLYGLGMGGYWEIGASYAMESAPRRKRGALSGPMQGGYPCGYLLASIAIQTIAPAFGCPSSIRGLSPGFVYQLGVLVASPALPVQTFLQSHFGYPWALLILNLLPHHHLLRWSGTTGQELPFHEIRDCPCRPLQARCQAFPT